MYYFGPCQFSFGPSDQNYPRMTELKWHIQLMGWSGRAIQEMGVGTQEWSFAKKSREMDLGVT
jgi:hypothetical protein